MKATWIWYPGDFEVWLGNKFNNRRTERGAMFPPFWKQDSHWPTVVFTKTFELAEEETLGIFAEGQYNIAIDGRLLPTRPSFSFPAGRHTLTVKVWNQATPPAIYIKGTRVKTDATWQATYEDKIWIDELGVAHGAGIYVPVGYWHFDESSTPPSQYRLPTTEARPVGYEDADGKWGTPGGRLYDFGREVFGCLKLKGLEGGTADIYYGESREEALDKEHCETLDTISSLDLQRRTDDSTRTYRLDSKAFRYVFIDSSSGTRYDDVAVDEETAHFDPGHSGAFRCSDELLNKIWDVSARTLELTTLEFFVDGIKRDRWVWSGDAIQSYLMNYYLHFDTDCVKRTIRQLRGKDPVTSHVNTIMDYSFYWFKSVLDYYQYTGDVDFVSELYPRMVTLMDYCLGRTNAQGMAEGQPDDWIFVDWVDFPMNKRGALAFEQILFWKALQTLQVCATLLHRQDEAERYGRLAGQLRAKTKELFFSPGQCAYLHAIEDGQLNSQVTKFPNMFAILYDFADDEAQRQILEHVLLNPDVDAITTPYMRFYELAALCKLGLQPRVLEEMKAYWGGMLSEGATSFWEKYNPYEHGTEHLAMYGRPYGKSLCHAWGASPLYLIGRYFLGVRPTKPGYAAYEVRPVLGGLAWMKGDVPTPFGLIHIEMDTSAVTIRSDGGHGTLILGERRFDIPAKQVITITL